MTSLITMLMDSDYDLVTSKEPNRQPPPLPPNRRPLPAIPPEKEQERILKENQQQLSSMKAHLRNWQPLICAIVPVLQWSHAWHPLLLLAVNAATFMLFRYLRVSAISVACLGGMVLALGEMLIPIAAKTLRGHSNSRDDNSDLKFEQFCQAFLTTKQRIKLIVSSMQRTRESFPQFFATGICIVLLFAAILFNSLGDFATLFIVSTLALLLPGFVLNGYNYKIQRYFQCFWKNSDVCPVKNQVGEVTSKGDT